MGAETVIKSKALWHISQYAAITISHLFNGLPIQPYLPRRWLGNVYKHTKQRCFARSIWSEEAVDATAGKLERERLYGPLVSILLGYVIHGQYQRNNLFLSVMYIFAPSGRSD
ncbi:hypothetical protein D3C85_1107990 [compost metagenome]